MSLNLTKNNIVKKFIVFMTSKTLLKYWITTKFYVIVHYYIRNKRIINLKNPKTFNDKLHWLKIYYKNPQMTIMVDKYRVREFVQKKIGNEYLNELFGVYPNSKSINFDELPNQFVIKCNHGSGFNIICKDKEKLDKQQTIRKLDTWLKKDFYFQGRQWPYKNVKPLIIVEKYLKNKGSGDLYDYKFFCFEGVPKYIQVDINRFKDHKRNFYSTDWKPLSLKIQYSNDFSKKIEKPQKLKEMLTIAAKLSNGFPHVRVDLYYVDSKIIFGELTFYHGNGMEKFYSYEWEIKLGNQIKLKKIN